MKKKCFFQLYYFTFFGHQNSRSRNRLRIRSDLQWIETTLISVRYCISQTTGGYKVEASPVRIPPQQSC
jgi:hypothetical protein